MTSGTPQITCSCAHVFTMEKYETGQVRMHRWPPVLPFTYVVLQP